MPFSLNPRRSGSLTDIRTRIITEPWQNFFNVEDTIGRGKFAVVKKCVEKSSGRRFAAKCIRKRRHCRDCTPDIFHEIAVLEISTHHPHLINLYKVYETTTEVTLILEYAAGGEIFDHCIGVKDPFNETTTRRLLQQILEAVDFLHSNNIVHLDLKPQNILLTEGGVDGDIKLVDFGLSKILAQEIEIREILGTPDYVAPEVLNFEPISTLTDIWSLGVVCYVMLTGVSPFLGDNKNETLMNVTTGVLDFPDDLFKSKNVACKDLMTKMLQRDPSMRINARECLQHPWLVGFVHPRDNILPMQDEVFPVDVVSGITGSGNTGSGNTGSGNTGSDNTGSGNTGSGNTESGNTGSGKTESGNTGSGNTGSGNTGSDNTESGITGSGNTESGNTGSGNTETGNTGSGNTGSGNTGSGNTVSDATPTINGNGTDMNGNLLHTTKASELQTTHEDKENSLSPPNHDKPTTQHEEQPKLFPVSPKQSTKRRRCDFIKSDSNTVHVYTSATTSKQTN